jgi:hypothetical protein
VLRSAFALNNRLPDFRRMNPEHLPLLALLIAAIFVAGVAIGDLMARRWLAGLRAGGVALLALALAFVGGTRLGRHEQPRITRLHGLVPVDAQPGDVAGTGLILGGVSVSIASRDRCVLAFEGIPFLTLDSLRSGVLVTCRAALPEDGGPILWREPPPIAASVSQNAVWDLAQGVRAARPDPHTLVVSREDGELLKVRHLAPGAVEVAGELWAQDGGSGSSSGRTIHLRKGIRWPGGSIPAGPVDLTPQGEGKIDLERNGSMHVIPE